MSTGTPELSHVQAMWADDEASRGLGMELLDVGHDGRLGWSSVRMAVTEVMVNGHKIMHGGLIFTLCDSAFALACNATGRLTVASGCDINFVTSARLGDVLVAQAQERAAYGRNGLTDVTVTRESDGELIAEFRGRSRALTPRTAAQAAPTGDSDTAHAESDTSDAGSAAPGPNSGKNQENR